MRDPNQGSHNLWRAKNGWKHYWSPRGDRKRAARRRANAIIRKQRLVRQLDTAPA